MSPLCWLMPPHPGSRWGRLRQERRRCGRSGPRPGRYRNKRGLPSPGPMFCLVASAQSGMGCRQAGVRVWAQGSVGPAPRTRVCRDSQHISTRMTNFWATRPVPEGEAVRGPDPSLRAREAMTSPRAACSKHPQAAGAEGRSSQAPRGGDPGSETPLPRLAPPSPAPHPTASCSSGPQGAGAGSWRGPQPAPYKA